MKKSYSYSLVLLFITLFLSCKKNEVTTSKNSLEDFVEVQEKMKITKDGFLKFNSSKEVLEFSKISTQLGKEKSYDYLKGLGFKMKQKNYAIESVEDGNYDDYFNADGLLEVSNVILKLTDNKEFFLTLQDQFADATNIGKLINESYDPLYMNKILVERNLVDEFDLSNFINLFPNGINENPIPLDGKPCIGTVTTTYTIVVNTYDVYGNCIKYTHTMQKTDSYVMWVKVGSKETYIGATQNAGTGC